jgi:hypothetical protein
MPRRDGRPDRPPGTPASRVGRRGPGRPPSLSERPPARLGTSGRDFDHLPEVQDRRRRDWVYSRIPDVRDGLTRIERLLLYVLYEAQQELGGRNVPTATLYGRLVEHVDISVPEMQAVLQRLVGVHGIPRPVFPPARDDEALD